MLTEEEYNELLPHKEAIMRFEETRSYKGGAMELMDKIRQRRGWGAVCYSCDGSKVNAITDTIGLIKEYEKSAKTG